MMAADLFLCQGGEEKFAEAVKLNDVDSQDDPVTDPYRSKYKARQILSELKKDVEDLSDSSLGPAMGALLNLRLGMNYYSCEELSTGEEHLMKCVDALEDRRLDPVCCNTLQTALNELGILYSGRGDCEKAQTYLEKAKKLYEDYKSEVGSSPEIADNLFKVLKDQDEGLLVQKRANHFESGHTHTLYYLAQIYGQLGDSHRSAQYCRETLRRQLDTKSYDCVEWALNAATLSQYYMSQGDFTDARHCLCSALQVLQETGDAPAVLTVTPDPQESHEELMDREKIPKAWADTYRCFIKYGLGLLETSRDRLMESLVEGEGEQPEKSERAPTKHDQSARFNLELTALESLISDKHCLVFEDARLVFLQVQKWINSAKEFYVLDGHCTDHIEIVQDHSTLYKVLAFFEPSFDRQCKMHKRRVDMIQEVLSEISQQHYMLICRQLIYELAEIYSTMLDLKLSIVEESGSPPSAQAAAKMNQLARASIAEYERYLDTLKTPDKQTPEVYSDDDERPALVAHFCLGRLYSKLLEFQVTTRLRNLQKSLDYYKFLVDYCRRNPKAEPKMRSENDICKEMVLLLPSKMERIRAQSEV